MITVNLELSQKLKEAGYPQKGYFYWVYRPARKKIGMNKAIKESYRLEDLKPEWHKSFTKSDLFKRDKYMQDWLRGFSFFASPTADEILEKITGRVSIDRYSNKSFSVHWMSEPMTEFSKTHMEKEETLPDTLAKLWLYLKENNLLEVKG